MSTRDLKHPWKPSVWIIWISPIVLGSWLLQAIRTCVKEPYFTIFCGKLCRIGQDHAEPGQDVSPQPFHHEVGFPFEVSGDGCFCLLGLEARSLV